MKLAVVLAVVLAAVMAVNNSGQQWPVSFGLILAGDSRRGPRQTAAAVASAGGGWAPLVELRNR